MTIDKNKLGNKRVALNTLAEAIDTNIKAAATVTVADTANLYAGENVEACLAELAGAGRTSETVKSVDTLIDNHIADATAAHAATAISVGATTITATEVDAAFAELSGTGRTSETVKDNADNIEDLTETAGCGTFATGSITYSVSGGKLAITSRIAGTSGNAWTITPIAIVGTLGDVTVDATAKTITVEVTDTVTTDLEMAQYINEDYIANKIVFAVGGTATVSDGAVDVDEVITMARAVDSDEYTVDENSLLTTDSFEDSGKPKTLYGATQLLSDGANILNQRAVLFPVHREHIYKYGLRAVATYDFDVHGGEIGTIDLTANNVVPDNAIIREVVIDVVTELVTTDVGGSVTFLLPTDGDLSEAITDTAAALFSGKPGNFALDGNALTAANMAEARKATWIKTTAARKIQAKIETKTVTQGKIDIIVIYDVTE